MIKDDQNKKAEEIKVNDKSVKESSAKQDVKTNQDKEIKSDKTVNKNDNKDQKAEKKDSTKDKKTTNLNDKDLVKSVSDLEDILNRVSNIESSKDFNTKYNEETRQKLDQAYLHAQTLIDRYNAEKLRGTKLESGARDIKTEGTNNKSKYEFNLDDLTKANSDLIAILSRFAYVQGQTSQNVNTWDDLAKSLNDQTVTTINIDSELEDPTDLSAASIDHSKPWSQKFEINRDLTINGNGHQITVGNGFLHDNNTQTLTLNNIKVSTRDKNDETYNNFNSFKTINIEGNSSFSKLASVQAGTINISGTLDVDIDSRGYNPGGWDPHVTLPIFTANTVNIENNATLNVKNELNVVGYGSQKRGSSRAIFNVVNDVNFGENSTTNISVQAATTGETDAVFSKNLNGVVNQYGEINVHLAQNASLKAYIQGGAVINDNSKVNMTADKNSSFFTIIDFDGSSNTSAYFGNNGSGFLLTATDPKEISIKSLQGKNLYLDYGHFQTKITGNNIGLKLNAGTSMDGQQVVQNSKNMHWFLQTANNVDFKSPDSIASALGSTDYVTPNDSIVKQGSANKTFNKPEDVNALKTNTYFSEIDFGTDLKNLMDMTDAGKYDVTGKTINVHYDQTQNTQSLGTADNDITFTNGGSGKTVWIAGNVYDAQGDVIGRIDANGNFKFNTNVSSTANGATLSDITNGTKSIDKYARVLVTYADGTTDTVPVQINVISAVAKKDNGISTRAGVVPSNDEAKSTIENATDLNSEFGNNTYSFVNADGSALNANDLSNATKNGTASINVKVAYANGGYQIVPVKIHVQSASESFANDTVDSVTVHAFLDAQGSSVSTDPSNFTWKNGNEDDTSAFNASVDKITWSKTQSDSIPDWTTPGEKTGSYLVTVVFKDRSNKTYHVKKVNVVGYESKTNSISVDSRTDLNDVNPAAQVKFNASNTEKKASDYQTDITWVGAMKDSHGNWTIEDDSVNPENQLKNWTIEKGDIHALIKVQYHKSATDATNDGYQLIPVVLKVTTQADQFKDNYSGKVTLHAKDAGDTTEATDSSNFIWTGAQADSFKNNISSITWSKNPDLTKLGQASAQDVTVNFKDGSSNTYKVTPTIVGYQSKGTVSDKYYGDDLGDASNYVEATDNVSKWTPAISWADKDGNAITLNTAVNGNFNDLYAKVDYHDGSYQLIKIPVNLKSRKSDVTISSNSTDSDPLLVHINTPSNDFNDASGYVSIKDKNGKIITAGQANISDIKWATPPTSNKTGNNEAQITVTFKGGESKVVTVPYKVVQVNAGSDMTASKNDKLTGDLTDDQINKYINASDLNGKFNPSYSWQGNVNTTWAPDHTSEEATILVTYHKDGQADGSQELHVTLTLKSDADLTPNSDIQVDNSKARAHYDQTLDSSIVSPAISINNQTQGTDYTVEVSPTQTSPFTTEQASVNIPVTIKFADGSTKTVKDGVKVAIDRVVAKDNIPAQDSSKDNNLTGQVQDIDNYVDNAQIKNYQTPAYTWYVDENTPADSSHKINTQYSNDHQNATAWIRVDYKDSQGNPDGFQMVKVSWALNSAAKQLADLDAKGQEVVGHVDTTGTEKASDLLAGNITFVGKDDKTKTLDQLGGGTVIWLDSPDLTKAEEATKKAKIIFNDGSILDSIEIPVKVIGATANSTVEVGKDANISNAADTTVTAESQITNQNDLTGHDWTVKYEWVNADGTPLNGKADTHYSDDHTSQAVGIKVSYYKNGKFDGSQVLPVTLNIDHIAGHYNVNPATDDQAITTHINSTYSFDPNNYVKVTAKDGYTYNQDDIKSIDWTTKPDISKAGESKAVVTVTFKDNSTATVSVPVHVKEAELKNNEITVDANTSVDPASQIKNNEDLSEWTPEYTWVKTPDTEYRDGHHEEQAQILVTYHKKDDSSKTDGTQILDITLKLHSYKQDWNVSNLDGDHSSIKTHINTTDSFDPKDYVKITDASGKTYDNNQVGGENAVQSIEWTTDPNTKSINTTPAQITVTYKNGETETLEVPVTVYGASLKNNDITVDLGKTLDNSNESAYKAKDQLSGTENLDQFNPKYEWLDDKGNIIASNYNDLTEKQRTKAAKVRVTYYKDKAQTQVDGNQVFDVELGLHQDSDDYKPEPRPITIDPTNPKTPKPEDGVKPETYPKDAILEWPTDEKGNPKDEEGNPIDITKPGKYPVDITITYPDGSKDTVKTEIIVPEKPDQPVEPTYPVVEHQRVVYIDPENHVKKIFEIGGNFGEVLTAKELMNYINDNLPEGYKIDHIENYNYPDNEIWSDNMPEILVYMKSTKNEEKPDQNKDNHKSEDNKINDHKNPSKPNIEHNSSKHNTGKTNGHYVNGKWVAKSSAVNHQESTSAKKLPQTGANNKLAVLGILAAELGLLILGGDRKKKKN